MSILQYPETATNTELQVWNNAAFDGKEFEGFSFPVKSSWSSIHSTDSLRSDSTKENLSPAALNSSPVPAKNKNSKGFDEPEDERKIDLEIRQIEDQIKRLTSKLESLRLQKAAAAAKTVERRGRIVPAKFMELKQSSQSSAVKIIEETPKTKVAMAAPAMRRGMSLGPAEIFAGGGRFSSIRPGKANIANATTAVPATQSRRKSCFWKLDGVDEVKAVSERKKTLSLSPKSKRIGGRCDSVQGSKQAATVTLGTRKSGAVAALVQPRKLFKEGEKSVPNKKAVKPGRMIASRYNNNNGGNSVGVDARKRSLPENDKDNDGGKRWDKRRASSLRGSGQGSEVRVKKRWEIPAQVVMCKKKNEEVEVEVEEEKEERNNAGVSGVLLRKIRTLRYLNESPRDSGAAKRVADLNGKRSYFCPDGDNDDGDEDNHEMEEDEEESVCQVLSFDDDDDGC
ncbi:hypothetical protein HN51_033321 [Arachis hypogaea]|uniref:uncharacterized protein n=1 Tax=Arachis hypogaea TaxID=3818 RepID=UPI000DECCC26|nr:uncharacterized protein LOC112716948 [Arachis hypogaea]QHO17805.1 uncharacterized protein DS421_10g315250 [Arachis hypogaea]